MKENVQNEPEHDIIKDIEEFIIHGDMETTAYATALNHALLQTLIDKGFLQLEDMEVFNNHYETVLQQILNEKEEDTNNDKQKD